MNPGFLLTIYCFLILLASLAGGWIPMIVRLTHKRLQIAISFVSGLMLGVGLLHLIPHAWHELHSIDRTTTWLLVGFLVMFFIQRFFHFHHHDVPEGPDEDPHADCGGDHSHHPGELGVHSHNPSLAEQSARRLSWTGAALGLLLHTIIDGLALGASVEAATNTDHPSHLLGLGTFLVIFLHKPFDALAIGTLLARSGSSRKLKHVVNGLFAIGIPVGVLLFHFGIDWFGGTNTDIVGLALAFAAGTFLCIAASDLLPELQFHEHDRVKLSLALLIGLMLAVLIGKLETSGHDHLEHSLMKQPAASIQDVDVQ